MSNEQQLPFRPLVSIVIPVYNGNDFVDQAIRSAQAQTYSHYEIIVVNDGSSDNGKTAEICKSYGSGIRYFEKENGGVSTALNFAIQEMKGDYFSWLSHDDLYLPEKLERQIEALSRISEEQRESCILYCDVSLIDDQCNRLGKVLHFNSTPFLQNILLECNLNGCSLLVPKKAFQKVGTFNISLKTVQDIDLWSRMFLAGFTFVRIPEVLVLSRIHANQASKTMQVAHTSEINDFYIGIISAIRAEPKQLDASHDLLREVSWNHLHRFLFKSALNAYQNSKWVSEPFSNRYLIALQFWGLFYFQQVRLFLFQIWKYFRGNKP